MTAFVPFFETGVLYAIDSAPQPIVMETVSGKGIWIDPKLRDRDENGNSETGRRTNQQEQTVKVWFDRQLLGTGDAYQRRSMEFSGAGRKQLRVDVVKALQNLSDSSHKKAAKALQRLQAGWSHFKSASTLDHQWIHMHHNFWRNYKTEISAWRKKDI